MVVLINLESAVVRRHHMAAQLAALGMTFERVGFDLRGREPAGIQASAHAVVPNIEFDLARLSGAEVGCWISHLAAWKRLFASPDRLAGTVIEDDIVLAEDFPDVVATLEADARLEVVLLGTSSRNLSQRNYIDVDGVRVHAAVGAVYNTWGYVIRRAYAERLLALPRLTIDVPIDHVLGGRQRVLKPALGVVQPASVHEDAELGPRSQIEPHTPRIDRWRVVEQARRRVLASRLSEIYYSIYRLL